MAQQALWTLASKAPLVTDTQRADDVAALYPEAPAFAKDLLKGMAGSSAYLAGLLEKEATWLNAVGQLPPDAIVAQIFDDLKSMEDLAVSLRIGKRRIALLTALADLGEIWSLEKVTRTLSDFADCAIDLALNRALKHELEKGRLPACTEEDLKSSCGVFVLGMGKLGARELNYSSDIDLIVMFDDTRYSEQNVSQARKIFIRATQSVVKTLSERTEHGYVFRTDLRLRPDPAVTPVCMAMGAAEQYYEALGRTWERAAMIKARVVGGDIAAGERFLKHMEPFIWRRHLDFAAIAEAQDMILKIREHKALHGALQFAGHDVKLGLGGIREIEFFAQTHQLIFGGRQHDLRVRSTVDALRALQASKRISKGVRDNLIRSYTHHRALEHRIQMLDDAQTHTVPKAPERREHLARLSGFESAALHESASMPVFLLAHENTAIVSEARKTVSVAAVAEEFSELFETREQSWAALPALRNAKSHEVYQRIRPKLMERFATTSQPETALLRFERFLSGLPSGVQLFSLFESRPQLLDLVVDISAIAPNLAEYLGRNKSVLDAVLDLNFFEPFQGFEALLRDAERRLESSADYEDVLNDLRRWQKDAHFRNGVHLLRGLSTPKEAARVYSMIAEASVRVLLPHVEAHLAERYGPAPGRGAVILAMGKLGSEEMTASSDLDLIVIYDAKGETETTGRKPLAVGAYFSRFTQTLISALTVQTSEGSIYEVDMRLRPSGRKGPVATSLAAFESYQQHEAWTWEHLALTRARVVGGDETLASDVESAIVTALSKTRDTKETLDDVVEMRARLQAADAGNEVRFWKSKRGPGRLLDMELCAQTGALLTGCIGQRSVGDVVLHLEKHGWLNAVEAEGIKRAYSRLSALQQIERLFGDEFDPETGSERLQEILFRVTGEPSVEAIRGAIEQDVSFVEKLVDQKLTG